MQQEHDVIGHVRPSVTCARQVHIRRGQPWERLLQGMSEVVLTAAAISFCTVAFGHVHHRATGRP